MRERKENRKTRYTQMVLRESLIELMMEKPFSKITVTELCEKADINRTTFYSHYKDQYDLLLRIEEEPFAYFETMLKKYDDKRSKREVMQMVEELVSFIADNSNSIQVLLGENGDIHFQKKLFNHFISMKQVMKYFSDESDESDDQAMKEYSFVFVASGTLGLFQHWLKNDMDVSPSQIVKILVELTQLPGK